MDSMIVQIKCIQLFVLVLYTLYVEYL